MDCFECKSDFTKNKTNIICAVCGNKFHLKCASINNPNVPQTLVEQMKKSKGAIAFVCISCATVPPEHRMSNKLTELEASINKLTAVVSNSVVPELNNIRMELTNCVATIKRDKEYLETKIKKLEIENNIIRKQLNRGDILISGLPSTMSLDEMYEIVPKICKVYDIDVLPSDVSYCSWIRNKTVMMVKFNSIRKKDELLKRYFKSRNLELQQLIETDVQKRIYLNDNLTPMAANLRFMCRKLLQTAKISKFRILNTSIPEAKVTMQDGSLKSLNTEEICDLLNGVQLTGPQDRGGANRSQH